MASIADSEGLIRKKWFLAYDDENTYTLFNNGETIGVLQLGEWTGMYSLCKWLEVRSGEEIGDINAMYRLERME
jgi:DNA polymerase III alpha subunit